MVMATCYQQPKLAFTRGAVPVSGIKQSQEMGLSHVQTSFTTYPIWLKQILYGSTIPSLCVHFSINAYIYQVNTKL